MAARTAAVLPSNGNGPTPAAPPAPEPVSRQARKRESRADQAIREIKKLVSLKLQVQEGRERAGAIRDALTRLFTDEELTREQADILLEGIDELARYIQLRRDYLIAREKARPALTLLAESEISEEDLAQFD
jgi:alkanesulfonate monooxygenase SsuD/methylene tetrahydromethanopterin reductase-like flavin-dependent oxidoreductase (luciferase family)